MHYTHRAANNKGVPCLKQQRPVVVVDWARKPLGSSPDAWLALEIARCVLNTRRRAVSRLKTAGRKSVFHKEKSHRDVCRILTWSLKYAVQAPFSMSDEEREKKFRTGRSSRKLCGVQSKQLNVRWITWISELSVSKDSVFHNSTTKCVWIEYLLFYDIPESPTCRWK